MKSMNRLRRFSEALVLVEKSMVRFQVSELLSVETPTKVKLEMSIKRITSF